MIDHLSIGVRDIVAARRFYDAVLAPLGYRLLQEFPTSLGYGDGHAALWLLEVERPAPADAASGLHLCFSAPTRQGVDAFHQAALAAGGKDNGKPGLRADYGPALLRRLRHRPRRLPARSPLRDLTIAPPEPCRPRGVPLPLVAVAVAAPPVRHRRRWEFLRRGRTPPA